MQIINLQSILFDKKSWTKEKACKWLKDNNYEPIKDVHETKNKYRYRINYPYFRKYRTIKNKQNISFVFGIQ